MKKVIYPPYSVAVVVPVHIQPTEKWVKSLKLATKGHTVIIVDDSDGKVKLPDSWDIYDYNRQKKELGDELYAAFETFHKSSACRNFGHWVAYRRGFDIIIGLDSDCNVPKDFVTTHINNLVKQGYGWVNPIEDTNWFPRGYPYFERTRKIVLSMGLWSNELDVNGLDRVHNGKPPKSPKVERNKLAHSVLPLCGMNFAMWSRAVPGFLFLPNYDNGSEKFRRYDDIWGGYIFQKLMQKQKDMITYGLPIVYHDTVIDAQDDAEKEAMGVSYEEFFYKLVDSIMKEVDVGGYSYMFSKFSKIAPKYFKGTVFEQLLPAFEFWSKLYEPKKTK